MPRDGRWCWISCDWLSCSFSHLQLIQNLAPSKVWTLKNNTNLIPFFCLIKSSKIDFISHLHFTWLYGSWYQQRILKISHFENMTAGFLQRCQNLLRHFTPEMMHFQVWKKWYFVTKIVLTYCEEKLF